MSDESVDATDKSASDTTRVVLVQCTKEKCEEKDCYLAKNLYESSSYYRKQRQYAEAVGDRWFIQSAKYGLLHPDEPVAPYDKHAKDIDDPHSWAKAIAADLEYFVVAESATVEILGGAVYADPLTPELELCGFEVHEPLRGQGIGKRQQTLARMAERELSGRIA